MTTDREELLERVLGRGTPGDDPAAARVLADLALEASDKPLLAAALDRAYGLTPHDTELGKLRAQALEELTVREHGLVFRYIPAGSFLMGSETGDADERPVHLARTPGFWLSDTPVSWADYCRLMDWDPPPSGVPREGSDELGLPPQYLEGRIRLQYCETQTLQASDWHAHVSPGESFGEVQRADASAPDYGSKPMVAVDWDTAAALGVRLSTATVQYGLPTEVEWERAARGGLIGARYSWGDEPPAASRCDSAHFGDFVLRPPRSLPPNGYGLYGMCGGVSEWTCDCYDALAYDPRRPPMTPTPESQRVLRGGSFADDDEAVTVSFRMALRPREGGSSPTVGFRLVRRQLG